MADYANASVVIETVPPADMGAAIAADAAKKAKFGTIHLLIRGFLVYTLSGLWSLCDLRDGCSGHTARGSRTCLPGGLRHAELPRPGDGDGQLRDDAHRHVRRDDYAVPVSS